MTTLLFGFAIGNSAFFSLVMTVLACAAIGYLLYRGDARVEARREHAIEIAAKSREEGFEILPELLEKYAIGDYSGLVKEMAVQYRIFRKDDARRAMYMKFLKRQLEVGLADPERRAKIYEAVEAQKILDDAAEKVVADKVAAKTK